MRTLRSDLRVSTSFTAGSWVRAGSRHDGCRGVARAARRGNARSTIFAATGASDTVRPMMARLPERCAASLLAAAVLAAATPAAAEGAYKNAEPSEVHGSQVASSEWLPIMIGGSAGLIIGGLVGGAFDDRQPPLFGALLGGGIGAVAGGGGGAWVIRGAREQDTRLAASITCGAVGIGIGSLVFANTIVSDKTETKIGGVFALVAIPVMGWLVGNRLAVHLGGVPKPEAKPIAIAAIRPSAAPVMTNGVGATGVTFGIDGAFF
jgi:hypothetical protein